MPFRPNRRAKTLSVLATVAVGATVLVGCSPSPENNSGSPQPATITFAASTLGDPGRGPGLQKLIDEYNASQSTVTVQAASVPYPTFGQTVLTQMGGGEGPDLVRFDMPEFSTAAASALLEPLDDKIDASKLNLIAGPDKYLNVDGNRYGVVFENSNYGMFYNKDLIPEAPKTFDEFVETAKATTKGDVYGLAFRQTQAEEAGVWQDIYNYVLGFGGDWSDGGKLTLDSPEVIEGLEKYKELYDANVIPKGADAATFRKMFANGKVGMELNNGGYVTATKSANPALNFSVARIPFPEKKQGSLLAPIVINANSKHKDAALDFIQWILKPEQQVKLQEVLGASSVATPTERSAESLEKYPFLPELDKLTESGVPQIVNGFGPQTADIRRIVVTEVLSSLQGQQDMKTAMEKAQKQAEELVR
ncbi:ABC transporter substrate-binding protein [Paenarthrobacter ureafaciens]|jgi:multiple sugar transport system substrate-binding protein|uniref:ABC transporter substrate-binding protein n=1 Tax=Paenarthrobacter ureafaciens TaxID=37931 RepID=UPI0019174DA7|nr:sugar ABC transporter substrate-binding protein [Paenarthrobacter ureafaciens]QQQ62523.1 sugar ABC transporter substrate-binding protein [Paenarthrobacter ureafaciens]